VHRVLTAQQRRGGLEAGLVGVRGRVDEDVTGLLVATASAVSHFP
jgi:hypothetical protein